MSAKWEKQEGNEGVLTFELEADEFEKGLDEAFKKVVKDVEIPGFRKGRVPRMIFENRFGVESLYQDAVDILLPDAYTKAVDEAGIEPVDQPEVDIEQIEKGKDLIFTAKVTVKPEVKLGEYKDLEVQDQDTTVTDEEVDEAINSLQEQHAELVVKEEGQIENGDTVVIDFEGFIDGEPFEGGKAEEHSLEIGSGQFIPGFEEELIGKDISGDTEVEVTFPEDYQVEELAGKNATFSVKIHEVKSKEFPELDDEFAKDVDDDVESLDDLRAKKKDELQSQKDQDNDSQKRQSVVEQATENAEVDMPEAMVDTETDRMVQEFEQQLQQQGMTKEMYFQFSGQDENALKEQMKDDAKQRVKTNLTMETIAVQEDIKADDNDVNEELERTASQYNIELDQLKSMLGDNTEAIKEDLKLQKAIDFLVEHSKTVEPSSQSEE